jgi:hypothetical protein
MEWCSSNAGKIVLGVLAVVGAVLLVVAIVCTGGMALVPLLCAWGLSAGLAGGISIAVAGVALISTAIAFVPNTIDLIAAVDEVVDPSSNPVSDWNNGLHQMGWYNTVQGVANTTGAISGGIYSVGSIYNAAKGVAPAELKTFKSQGYTRPEINAAVRQDAALKSFGKTMRGMAGQPEWKRSLAKGNYGEMATDRYLRMNGYRRISLDTVTDFTTKHPSGIDGVYSKGGNYVIGEAKYGTSRLRQGQMTAEWIRKNLRNAVGLDVAKEIRVSARLSPDSVQSILSRVNSGFTPKVEISFLDGNTRVIQGVLK